MTEPSDGPSRRLHSVGQSGPGPRDAVRWEVEHYVAERAERLIDAGWDPDEARREAERRFARRYRTGMETIAWRRWTMRWMGSTWRIVRGGFGDLMRTVRRSPGFAVGVVLTLALGIGANAAMFTMVDRLLLTPPSHVAEAEELRIVQIDRGSSTQTTITYPDFDDMRRHGGLAGAAAFSHPRRITRGSGADAEDLRARLVSHDFFRVLEVSAPVRGRFLQPADGEPGAPAAVVISAEYWARAFGSEPGAIGRTLRLSGIPFTVVGIAPEGFTGVTLDPVDVWLPMGAQTRLLNGNDGWRTSRNWYWVVAVVRAAPDANPDRLLAEATTLHQNARSAAFGEGYTETSIELAPLVASWRTSGGEATSVLRWLTGVSLVVLLIACANVANLLLARGVRRRRETAVRLALGVSPRRLVAQRALEAILLAAVGGVVALAVAYWGGGWVQRVLLPEVYFPDGGLNMRVVAFAGLISGLAGLLAGVAPAIQSTRAEVAEDLGDARRGSSSRRSRLRGALAVAQASLSVVLLVGAGLFVKSLEAVRDLDLGLDADRLVLASLELTDEAAPAAEDDRLYRRAADRLMTLRQVQDAALASPTFGSNRVIRLYVQGFDSLPDLRGGGPYYYAVSPGYASAMGLEILEGRTLDETDDEGAPPVALVSRTMAEALWPRESALGRCLLLDGEDAGCTSIVGVVEDAARYGLEEAPFMAYYVPLAQRDDRVEGLYVRASGDVDEARIAALRSLRKLGPEVRFARAETLRDILDPQARSWTLGATLFTVFGLLALVVAAVGLYSLLAFEVAERTRELGIGRGPRAGRCVVGGPVPS